MTTPVQKLTEFADATIAASGSLSDAVDLSGRTLTGILIPSAWTAAGLSFEVSQDNSTYVDLIDTSGEVTFSVAASQYVGLDPSIWIGVNFVKVRSGTTATPVAQAAERVLSLSLSNLT